MKNHLDWRAGGLNLLGSYIHAGFVQIWNSFYRSFSISSEAAMYTVHSIFEALFGSKWPTWMTIDQFLRPATLTLTGLELKIWSASFTQMSANFEIPGVLPVYLQFEWIKMIVNHFFVETWTLYCFWFHSITENPVINSDKK